MNISSKYRVALMSMVGAFALAGACVHAEESPAAPAANDQGTAEKAYIAQSFDKIDANHDGTIDKAEWQAFMTRYIAKQKSDFDASFAAADANHDGKLSRNEAKAANPLLYKYFDDIDTNGDGFITADELRAAMLQKRLQSVEDQDTKGN